MTTKAAEAFYLAEHQVAMDGKGYAIINPNNQKIDDLPTIYGFNNGGSSVFLSAVLMSEDGEVLGGHACSDEAYMLSDLGILEGERPDRHETFIKKYPKGYKMDFVGYEDCKAGLNKGLAKAQALYDEKKKDKNEK